MTLSSLVWKMALFIRRNISNLFSYPRAVNPALFLFFFFFVFFLDQVLLISSEDWLSFVVTYKTNRVRHIADYVQTVYKNWYYLRKIGIIWDIQGVLEKLMSFEISRVFQKKIDIIWDIPGVWEKIDIIWDIPGVSEKLTSFEISGVFQKKFISFEIYREVIS